MSEWMIEYMNTWIHEWNHQITTKPREQSDSYYLYFTMFVTRKQDKKKQNDVLIRELTKVTDDNSNDNAVNSKSRCKNLRNKHLRKELSVLGITQRATRPTNANGQAA